MNLTTSTVHSIIWDWNGTLLDDTWLCVEIINQVLGDRKLPLVTRESHQEMFDFPVIEYYRRLGFDLEKESFEVLGDDFMSQYEERKFECSLFGDVRSVMKQLQQAGVGQNILSAYHHDYLIHVLEHFELVDGFNHILGAGDHYATGKKEQAAILLKKLGIDPTQLLLIGDTSHDFDVAASVGIPCRLVTTGNHPRSKLDLTGAPVFNSLQEAVADLI